MSFDLKLHAYRLLMDEPFFAALSLARLRSVLIIIFQLLVFGLIPTVLSLK